MKDIKSILIGILGTTCVFLFLGTTSVEDSKSVNVYNQVESKRFELHKNNDEGKFTLLDTETGETWYIKSYNVNHLAKKPILEDANK